MIVFVYQSDGSLGEYHPIHRSYEQQMFSRSDMLQPYAQHSMGSLASECSISEHTVFWHTTESVLMSFLPHNLVGTSLAGAASVNTRATRT